MTPPKPQITIRLGASSDHLTVDGKTFDRNALSRTDNTLARKVIVGALTQSGYFAKEQSK